MSKDKIFASIGSIVAIPPENPDARKPIRPPRLPKRYLNSTRSMKVKEPPRRRERIRDYESFRKALENIKLRYESFLRNHAPPVLDPRPVQELKKFFFRYAKAEDLKYLQDLCFDNIDWKEVTIPDYRGPVGRWTGYYRTNFKVGKDLFKLGRVFLCFEGVDYRCHVFLNGFYVGGHEGFFAPFEFDVTEILKPDNENVLLIRIENDFPTIDDGDKIYAATGPGWDEPGVGWHHCPAGAGMFQPVKLEGRPPIFISDIFVRPDIDNNRFEAWIEVANTSSERKEVSFLFGIYARNFTETPVTNLKVGGNPAGPGKNAYRFWVKMQNYRLWNTESPYLYTLRCTLKADGEIDVIDQIFGMRKFHMDKEHEPKGALYLNNRRVFLRGANEMGHLQQCIMRGDYDQLFEDILIMKLANMNFLRFTQRPVQKEIYSYFDALGIMNQTDLPFFGLIRRNLFEEALRQTGEMERLIRSHPSAVVVSLINEPSGDCVIYDQKLEHRHLLGDELEEFFRAACSVINFCNPDRVVKLVEGTHCGYIQERNVPWGIQDFHCYVCWYGPGMWGSIDELHRGYLYSVKPGWMATVGEYGTEGLDSWETMRDRYPKNWIPEKPDDEWSPEKIPHSQTWLHHHSWFDTKKTLIEWVEESQAHQAWATRTMTDAFRRRADTITGFAVHLLIDAWPAGWLKTLVGVDRRPKPAYYEFADALTPLAVNIRTDRTRYFGGERLNLEFWIFNDTKETPENLELVWYVLQDDKVLFASNGLARIKPSNSEFQGYFRWKTPNVKTRTRFEVYLTLRHSKGNVLHDYSQIVEVFPLPGLCGLADFSAAILGKKPGKAWKLAEALGLRICTPPFNTSRKIDVIIADDCEELQKHISDVSHHIFNGGNLLLLEQDEPCFWDLPNLKIEVLPNSKRKDAIGHIGLDFVSCSTGHPAVKDFHARDFSYWYDFEKDRRDYIACFIVDGKGRRNIIASREMAVAAEFQYGQGKVIADQVDAVRRIPHHPIALNFMLNIIRYLCEDKSRFIPR